MQKRCVKAAITPSTWFFYAKSCHTFRLLDFSFIYIYIYIYAADMLQVSTRTQAWIFMSLDCRRSREASGRFLHWPFPSHELQTLQKPLLLNIRDDPYSEPSMNLEVS